MKTKINFTLYAALIVAIMTSCTLENRLYRPGYHVEVGKNKSKDKNNTSELLENDLTTSQVENETIDSYNIGTKQNKTFSNSFHENTKVEIQPLIVSSKSNNPTKSDRLSSVTGSFKNMKSSLLYVGHNNEDHNFSDDRKTHWGSIVGMVTGIVGLFVFGIVFGICAIIFSAIALRAITKNPDKYKGKGMAIAGLVLGIVGISLYIILLALLV